MTDLREIGIIGLGRMGFRLSKRLYDRNYKVTGFDVLEKNRMFFSQAFMQSVDSLEGLCKKMQSPKIIMLVVPAGDAVKNSILDLIPFLKKNDVILDCGNSYYEDSIAHSYLLAKQGIRFMDIGVSGGVSGARNGACLTIGGDKDLFERLEYLFQDISTDNGYCYVGPSGWGHLVKTIHNGIEYGFLQAIGEGLAVIHTIAEKESVPIDLAEICEVWNNGSIIESRLMQDAVKAVRMLSSDKSIGGKIGGGETGTWANKIAKNYDVSVPALETALTFRKKSQKDPDFTGKIIAAIRNIFGEHELFTKK